jgi:hypothetical protein
MTLQGKGFFIWKIKECENGNAEAIADLAEEADYSHILIKIADGVYSYNYDWDLDIDLVPPVAQALTERGIQTWGWHYIYGDDPIGEARKGIQRMEDLNLDGYVIDAESQFKLPGKDEAAEIFLSQLKAGITNKPIALSSYRFPSYHPQFPWDEFLSEVDYNMPQVYWIQSTNPGSQLTQSLNEFGDMPFHPPIVPVGAAFSEHGWQPNASEVLEFLDTARAYNLSAANFWEWSSCRLDLPADVWNTIRDYSWESGSPPPQDISAEYIAALNTHNADQVTDLYTSMAVHVTSTRTVQGTTAIRTWFTSLFDQILPNASFTLTGFSGTGNSRHFTWTASSPQGNVQNGNDTLGLFEGKIAYHYTFFTVT